MCWHFALHSVSTHLCFNKLSGDELPLHPYLFGVASSMGYLYSGVKLGVGVKYVSTRVPDNEIAVARSLGCHVAGVAPFYVSPNDHRNVEMGCRHRIGRDVPPFNRRLMRKFRGFVRKWVRKNLRPLDPSDIPTFEEWLASTNYTEARKRELFNLWEEKNRAPPRTKKQWRQIRRIKSFIKRESYLDAKHARWINSRSDWYKVLTGPYFKAIENSLFSLGLDGSDSPFVFIKHVPVADRPRFMSEFFEKHVGHTTFVETDHTAFEAHMVPDVLHACEFQLYSWMFKKMPEVMGWIRGTLDGRNRCQGRYGVLSCDGRRMSGEMCTSLGNGFTNLMVFLFIAQEVGCRVVCGFVEGDDGLFAVSGKPPQMKDFVRLGFEVKSDVHEEWTSAAFCGMTMAVEDNDFVVTRDPLKLLVKTGLTDCAGFRSNPLKLRGLLRAKAYSMAYEMPGCPIAGALGRYIERVTRDTKPDFRDTGWGKEGAQTLSERKMLNSLNTPVPWCARAVVSSRYHLPVRDQLAIEKYLDNKSNLSPLDSPEILAFVSKRYPLGFEIAETCYFPRDKF
jgi:hypothetical protein